jgi:hypothetical protein
MQMNTRGIATSVVLVLLCAAAWAWAAERDEPQCRLMKMKLEHVQGVLDGLVVEDFRRIAANARELRRLTETQWREGDSDEYRMHLKNFRFAVDELDRHAGEKNLEGAALTYVQTTMSCIGCHRYLRSR